MAQLWEARLKAYGHLLPVGTRVTVTTQFRSQTPNLHQIEQACVEQYGKPVNNTSITQWDIRPM